MTHSRLLSEKLSFRVSYEARQNYKYPVVSFAQVQIGVVISDFAVNVEEFIVKGGNVNA